MKIGYGYPPNYTVHWPRRRGRYYAKLRDDFLYPDRLGVCEPARSPLLRVRK